MKVVPVILCGGAGTRLWPLSRKSAPKQFARLLSERSLFQEAVARLPAEGPVIVTGPDYRFMVRDQLAEIGLSGATVLVEPASRNTAPAILVAALQVARTEPDTVLLIMPSDHAIPDAPRFRQLVERATQAAEDGAIVTFGIVPDRAETGYGWLELAAGADLSGPVALQRFVEKPPVDRAEAMLNAGNYLWNAGIFVAKASVLLEAFRLHQPGMFAKVGQSLAMASPDLSFIRLAAEPWEQVESISIDYAIMERCSGLVCIPFDGAWSDLGDWVAVGRAMPKGRERVASHGAVTDLDCTDTILWSEDPSVELVGIGLSGIIAVATDDAVLVADRSRAQDVKEAVSRLKAKSAKQAETASRDHRPWGWFESLALGSRFQVKRIVVKPGASLSLQSHVHRAEHWIVVEGTARVTIDDQVKLVHENQSVYVPLGARHRLENPGKVPMVLIEVQTGSYLGEDDITRYDDVYARGQGPKG